MRKLALIALVVTAASPAYAERDRREDRRWRWEGGFGFWLGSVSLSRHVDEDLAALGVGGHLELGARRRRWLLTSEIGFLSAHQTPDQRMPIGSEPPGGSLSRAGIAARYSVKQWHPSRGSAPFGGDLWFEFGAGVQRMDRSDEDRRFSRGDVKLGFGGELNGHGRKFHAGYYYAFSVLLARTDVPADRPATCAGPCDTATRPIPLDQTFLFNMGFVFGG